MESFFDSLRSYDFTIYYFFYNLGEGNPWFYRLFFFFAKFGMAIFLLSFTYLIWRKRINAFICSFIAMGLGAMTDLIIFVFWRRPRPFVTHEDIVNPSLSLFSVERMSSFPSSHTYIVFAIAISVYLYGHRRLGIALLILAFGVALGRIGTGLHYPSDTAAGAILGVLSGVLAYRFVHKYERHWEYATAQPEMDNEFSK
ncbi:MAG: phosphatase PAP2 family protein [Patescibacteria group bacterium]